MAFVTEPDPLAPRRRSPAWADGCAGAGCRLRPRAADVAAGDPRAVRADRAVRRRDRAVRPDRTDPGRQDLRAALLGRRRQLAGPARHRFPGPGRPEPADLRRARVADRRRDGNGRRRRHRHHARGDVGLSRRLGRPGDHARDRCLARPAGAGVRDLPGDHGRPQHVEHRHHPRRRVLDPLRPGHPRRGA